MADAWGSGVPEQTTACVSVGTPHIGGPAAPLPLRATPHNRSSPEARLIMSSVLRPTALLLLGAALAACSDVPQSVTGPSRSAGGPLFAAAQGGGNGKSSLD